MRQSPYTKQRRYIAQFLIVFAPAMLLIGCSSTPVKDASHKSAASTAAPALPRAGSGRGGYYKDDGPGEKTPEDLQAIPDAVPKVEPYSTSGNRPYVVFGKTYKPLTDNRPFKQRGIGSWYGKKFHGQKTSSGELYDMYKMTAAHPTLPIPSYARVTNIANGRQVIVRVNDRGPFHANRIIDLSYTAALKLGYLGTGSSELEVERLLPDDIARIRNQKQSVLSRPEPVLSTPTPAGVSQPDTALAIAKSTALPASITVSTSASTTPMAAPGSFYIQLGAYSQSDHAETMRTQFQQQWTGSLPSVEIVQNGALYRLFCGPFSSRDEATAAAQKIQENSSAKPLVVQR